MKNIKPYNQIKVGDIAMEHPDAGGCWTNKIGKIVWKGTGDELLKSKWKDKVINWGEEAEFIYDYDLVIVKTESVFEDYTLFNYDNDPCGVVVFED